MSTREIILRTRKNILFNFNTQSVEDALNIYIKNILGFNRGFEMSEAAWQTLSNLATSKPISVKLDLLNGLCKFARDRIDEIIVGSSSYPTITQDTVTYQVAENNTYAAVSGCIDNTAVSIIISDEYDGLPVSSINAEVFQNCKSLSEITIPASVTRIAKNAFRNCIKLKTINYLGKEEQWNKIEISSGNDTLLAAEKHFNYHTLDSGKLGDTIAFYRNPSDTVNIEGTGLMYKFEDAESPFYNDTSITAIDIGEGIESIGSCAFKKCSNLASITLPSSLETIKTSAFQECTSLKTVNLESAASLMYIESYAFKRCTSLISIALPESIKTIEDYAFSNCDKLASVSFVDIPLTHIGAHAFEFTSLERVDFSYTNQLKTIGDSAFANCGSLTSVLFPTTEKSALQVIGSQAFYEAQITTLDLSNTNLVSIGDEAFSYSMLTSITLPKSLIDIGNNTFASCAQLKTIYFGGTTEQWESISGRNTIPGSVQIICLDA